MTNTLYYSSITSMTRLTLNHKRESIRDIKVLAPDSHPGLQGRYVAFVYYTDDTLEFFMGVSPELAVSYRTLQMTKDQFYLLLLGDVTEEQMFHINGHKHAVTMDSIRANMVPGPSPLVTTTLTNIPNENNIQ